MLELILAGRKDGHYTGVKSKEIQTVTQPHNTDLPSDGESRQEKCQKPRRKPVKTDQQMMRIKRVSLQKVMISGKEDQDRKEKGKNVPDKSSNQHEERGGVLVPLDQENHQTGDDDQLLE